MGAMYQPVHLQGSAQHSGRRADRNQIRPRRGYRSRFQRKENEPCPNASQRSPIAASPKRRTRGSSTRPTRSPNPHSVRLNCPATRPRPLPSREPSRCASAWSGRDAKGRPFRIITGVKSPDVGKRGLLKHLKGKLGCGGAVKGAEIEIQGDQRERLVALLNELGYRAKQG